MMLINLSLVLATIPDCLHRNRYVMSFIREGLDFIFQFLEISLQLFELIS